MKWEANGESLKGNVRQRVRKKSDMVSSFPKFLKYFIEKIGIFIFPLKLFPDLILFNIYPQNNSS